MKDCRDIQPELSAYIDGELAPPVRAEVEAHLAACARCQKDLADLKKLAAGISALPRLQPAPQFLAEVRRKIAHGENPQPKVWLDNLFRPFWLKVPLEAVAVVVLVALVMRFERPAREPVPQYERAIAPASAQKRAPAREMAPSITRDEARSTLELQPAMPVEVVVVRAKDFTDVQNHAAQLAPAMNGRIVLPSERKTVPPAIFVELPPENVASFKTRLLQATERTKAVRQIVAESSPTPAVAPPPAMPMVAGSVAPAGKTETNAVVLEKLSRLGDQMEKKAPTTVLEIQVLPAD